MDVGERQRCDEKGCDERAERAAPRAIEARRTPRAASATADCHQGQFISESSQRPSAMQLQACSSGSVGG